MIIVEGPDGSGKTTLLNHISRRLGVPIAPRASDSLKGPVDDLCGWVDDDLLKWGTSPLKIYDRYPLISEPIYGPLLRGDVADRMTQSSWMRARMNTFRAMSLVIWCLPPYTTVIRNVDDEKGHMDGVKSQITGIWCSYAVMSSSWTGPGMTYDYTSKNPEPQTTHLVNLLRRHINGWKTL